jgi:hypothetical protein
LKIPSLVRHASLNESNEYRGSRTGKEREVVLASHESNAGFEHCVPSRSKDLGDKRR